MSRDHIPFPPPQQQVRYIQTNSPSHQMYSDYGIPIPNSEGRRSGDSDLYIFNGSAQQREIAIPSPSQSQTIKIAKSSSQKALPIIYNAYNNKNQEGYQGRSTPKQTISRESIQQSMKYQTQQPQFEENNSDVFQYRENYDNREEMHQTDANGFHTFKCLPPENHPQTAHFLQLPSEHSGGNDYLPGNYGGQIQKGPYQIERPSSKYQPFRTMTEDRQFGNPPVQIQPKSQSRVVIQGSMPVPQAPPSPRIRLQPSRQPMHFSDSSSKMIQIPQDQYQRFIDHLPMCKQSQEQIFRLQQKGEQLGQKQHFYWQQNMTLRQQNKRLRDLVSHFQKRQKELLREKEQFKEDCSNMVDKYRDSLLEEFTLLFQRYKLQMQRTK